MKFLKTTQSASCLGTSVPEPPFLAACCWWLLRSIMCHVCSWGPILGRASALPLRAHAEDKQRVILLFMRNVQIDKNTYNWMLKVIYLISESDFSCYFYLYFYLSLCFMFSFCCWLHSPSLAVHLLFMQTRSPSSRRTPDVLWFSGCWNPPVIHSRLNSLVCVVENLVSFCISVRNLAEFCWRTRALRRKWKFKNWMAFLAVARPWAFELNLF